jgi:hypothetical protein
MLPKQSMLVCDFRMKGASAVQQLYHLSSSGTKCSEELGDRICRPRVSVSRHFDSTIAIMYTVPFGSPAC